MAKLTINEKQILEKLFQMDSGYVLNFSDRSMEDFFKEEVGIDIYSKQYQYATDSKANYLRGFWLNANNDIVGKSIVKLIEYIDTQILIGKLHRRDCPYELKMKSKEIAARLLGIVIDKTSISQATFKGGNINIVLQKDILKHVQKLLNNGHYFNAVEEAYKVVRKKLRDITGKEKATDAFSKSNYEKIFGHQPKDAIEENFFEGVKFLHMSIQFLRNEKSHTPAVELDPNLAIHYIALASLAYDLINR